MNTEILRCDIRAALNYDPGTHHAELLNRAYVALSELQRWKDEEMRVMGTVLDYARSVAKCKLGESLTEWLVADHKRLASHDVEASVPTFPCEFCGVFHSYSEVAEAGGYCPQCEADYDERKMLADLLERYTALAAAPQPVAQDGWIPVSERLPEGTVLVSYTNNYNKSRIIRAKYVQKFTQESEDIDDFDAQYDEETDTYYDCEGWYEMIDNWGDYSSVAVTEGTVTHWMPLPSAPKGGE